MKRYVLFFFALLGLISAGRVLLFWGQPSWTAWRQKVAAQKAQEKAESFEHGELPLFAYKEDIETLLATLAAKRELPVTQATLPRGSSEPGWNRPEDCDSSVRVVSVGDTTVYIGEGQFDK